jgi:CDP-archaeol synthase
MEMLNRKAPVAARHALPAFGYLAALTWILVEATVLARSRTAPIFAHIATALWAVFPILVSGALHMLVVKDDLFHALARPIHNRWFGRSKTWRGAVVMPVFSVVGVYALELLFGFALPSGTFDFHRVTGIQLGLALGVAFILAELPNSYLKRRMNIAPGERSPRYRLAFTLGDQLDSVFACGLVYVIALGMPLTTFGVFLPVGVLSLLLGKRGLFHLGLRSAPT